MKSIFYLFSIITINLLLLFNVNRVYAELISPWYQTTSLPNNIASHTIYHHNNKLFIQGGANTTVVPTNISSQIDLETGNLGSWIIKPPLLPAHLFQSLTGRNENIYLLGGATFPPITHRTDVYLTKINTFGFIENWTQLTPLPQPLIVPGSAIINNHIYVFGGNNTSGMQSAMYSSPINPDGTIGVWTKVGDLPQKSYNFGLINQGNVVTIFGGHGASPNPSYLDKVYTTTVNPDGTISSWQETTPMPKALVRPGVVKVDNKVIVIGGDMFGTSQNSVYYANLNLDGTVGQWTESQHSLPSTYSGGGTVATDDYIYVTGGFGSTYLRSVYVAKINIESDPDPSTVLDVPYFNQNDLPWGPTEYDSTKALGVLNETMDRWGCAVTSAAMILNFHNMEQFPNGQNIDPGSLNEWLKQNNGYLKGKGPNGWYSYIDWNKIAVLTKDLYNAGESTIKLMHKRAYPSDSTTTLLNTDLTQFPDILQVKNSQTTGHFVVAKGLDNGAYQINDPEWNYTDLSSFNNTYYQVDRFIPSLTNFGYIEAIVNPEVELLVSNEINQKTGIDSNGNELDEILNATYAKDSSISNPDNSSVETIGTDMNVFLLSEPESGQYKLHLSGPAGTPYTLHIILYDSEGNSKNYILIGKVSDEGYLIQYSEDGESNLVKQVTEESISGDIFALVEFGYITNKGVAQSLQSLFKNLVKDVVAHRTTAAEATSENIKRILERERGKSVSEEAYQNLMLAVNSLLLSL